MTRAELLAAFNGPQPPSLLMQALLTHVLDRIEVLESTSTALATGGGFNLPQTDPEVVGALWDNIGTVVVSGGPV